MGYNYILLDDCWGGGRRNGTNQVYADPLRFPSGNFNFFNDYYFAITLGPLSSI
jgi:hypothetical protein